MGTLIPMEVIGVRIEMPSNQPIVLLREVDGSRFLPIWVGAVEATAIAFAQQGLEASRPLTHDLLRDLLDRVDITLTSVHITSIKDGVFFAEMNLRGMFTSDADGRFWFRTVKPAGYPLPVAGPVGDLLRAQGRQHYRPAHMHFMIAKPAFKTLISQVYVNDDPLLNNDPQFGVTDALVGDYVRHDDAAPDQGVETPWYTLDFTFGLEAGESKLPKPPIK